MAMFGFGRKREVIDLTDRYRKQQEKLAEMQGDNVEDISSSGISDSGSSSSNSGSSPGGFGFGIFGMGGGNSKSSTSNSKLSNSSDNGYVDVASPAGSTDKRRKLAKRIMDMTERLEDLSNQIYHLQQRIEVLERKSGTNRF